MSLGVQALNDADLRFLGRTHDARTALAAVDEMTKVFANHSLDLIYARPGQTAAAWEKELRQAAKLGVKHLSLYQLTIEEGTVFARKGVRPAPEEEAARMYEQTAAILAEAGYRQYEVSNYAAPGFECRHNLGYWRGDDYVGAGEGAAGRLRAAGKLFATAYPRHSEELSAAARAEELTIFGLRLNDGLDKELFKRNCGLDWKDFANLERVAKLIRDGLVEDTPQNIRATSAGRLLLDYVIEQICL